MVPEIGVDPACTPLAQHGIALPPALDRRVQGVLIPHEALQRRVVELVARAADRSLPERSGRWLSRRC